MNVNHLHKSIDIDNLIEWLHIQTDAGKVAFREKCSTWHSDIQKLKTLSYQFASVKEALTNDPETVLQIFDEIAAIEPDIHKLLEVTSDLERESSSELLFLHHILTPLNFIPFVLTLWSHIRVYILPGLSLLMPILMCVLPYIMLRFVFGIPIDIDRYLAMIVCMLAGDTSVLMSPDKVLSFHDILDTFTKSLMDSPIKAVSKLAGIGMTIGQSVIQPYLTFRHLYSINDILHKKSELLHTFVHLYTRLRIALLARGMELPKAPFPTVYSDREHVAHTVLDPIPYKLAFTYIGRIESLVRLAVSPVCSYVQWVEGPVQFGLRDTFDITVKPEQRKTISIMLHKDKHHALLTGPNRGGKSTALRAMCMSALLAHTYGCVLGKPVQMTPFTYMFASLKADDIPGSKSHFEREVDFTANTLKTDGPTLVFVDELFHTTNPPDALESCKLYCKDLWKRADAISVISTHLFDLVEDSPKESVQRLCCPATMNSDRTVNYQYGLEDGICKVSSVFEILSKYGFSVDCAVEDEMKKSQEGQK